MLTGKRFAELFQYQPNTGLFLVLKSRQGSFYKPGDVIAGSQYKDGYCYLKIDNKRYLAHRLAWFAHYGAWPVNNVDHINGVVNDNRIENLRDVTNQQNQQNRKGPQANNKSGFLGVSKQAGRSKFNAAIMIDGQTRFIGRFESAEEAYAAYLDKKRALHSHCTI